MTRPLLYRRRRGLDTRLVDGEAFVITHTTIQHLNPTATLVWLVLEAPVPQRAIIDFLRDLYPSVARRQLSLDVGKIIRLLRRMTLVTVKPGS